ncbi:MAG: hypothetical protein JNL78_06525 [Rhodocyclaceae bacterium]|jgi:uncharacterized membrane protein YidH (DUF202 family)|nr:hypothetical protein [Rhodocyclaceae bacterium]
MQPGLSFEQAPPISVPFRFFLTAPLFGMAAGLLLLWQGPAALASRWTGVALALTHLIAVGFMLQAMCGALLQMLPVAAGANIWQPQRVTHLTHAGLTIGTLLLLAGFLSEQALFFRIAVPFMTISLGAFAVIVLVGLFRTPAKGPTIVALRIAVCGLIITISLGATLASTFGWQLALPLTEITHVHAAWGLGGWSLLLVAGVGYLVVPMFQLTPPYPGWFTRGFSVALFFLLAAWSISWLPLQRPDALQAALACAAALLAAAFAAVTLRLQGQRRRKVTEPTLLFWRLAMVCLILAAAGVVLQQLKPGEGEDYAGTPFLLGVLLMVGVFMPVISGMLYKIMPFLNWLHLQKIGKPGLVVPNMRQMIPEPRMTMQLRLHLAALLLLLGAVPLPWLVYPGGLALIASCAWLEWNVVEAARNYARFKDELAEKLAAEQSA